MSDYRPCPECACHLKEREERCPFCGAAGLARAAAPRPRLPRMSRGQWLALAPTLALFGCFGAVSAADPHELLREAAAKDTFPNSSTVKCTEKTGTFGCGEGTCYLSTQACYNGQCVAYSDVEAILAVQSCGDCPSCGCIDTCNFYCTDNGFGGITLSDAACNPPSAQPPSFEPPSSSQGCYGSPPARPERRAGVSPRAARCPRRIARRTRRRTA
jgi:hypothetical protein